jgi:hypothetical protein
MVKRNKKNARKMRSRKTAVVSRLLSLKEMRYRNLLLDPCGADLVDPPFYTAGTGMFIRVRKVFSFPQVATAGTTCNVVARVVPSANAVVLRASRDNGAWGTGVLYPILDSAIGTYITRARPIAGCARLINMASYTTTSGLVGGGYAPDGLESNAGRTPDDTVGMLTHIRPNAKDSLEVKWFPTLRDTDFKLPDLGPTSDEVLEDSSVMLMGMGLDSGVNTGSAHTAAMRLEVVMVYEYQAATHTIGVPLAAKAPYGSLTNVLQTIGDLTAAAVSSYKKYSGPATALFNAVGAMSGGSAGFSGSMARLRIEEAL